MDSEPSYFIITLMGWKQKPVQKSRLVRTGRDAERRQKGRKHGVRTSSYFVAPLRLNTSKPCAKLFRFLYWEKRRMETKRAEI